jgi:anti-sigma factor ChrR (cupin superfamily)
MAMSAPLPAPNTPPRHRLADFVGGWVMGCFEPVLIASDDVEVAIKTYQAGDLEQRHHHRIATEYTVIATGRVRMNDQDYSSGEIIQMDPGQSTDFEALEPTITVVLKSPSVPGDKYLDDDDQRRTPGA